jgi:hypothetical protein
VGTLLGPNRRGKIGAESLGPTEVDRTGRRRPNRRVLGFTQNIKEVTQSGAHAGGGVGAGGAVDDVSTAAAAAAAAAPSADVISALDELWLTLLSSLSAAAAAAKRSLISVRENHASAEPLDLVILQHHQRHHRELGLTGIVPRAHSGGWRSSSMRTHVRTHSHRPNSSH